MGQKREQPERQAGGIGLLCEGDVAELLGLMKVFYAHERFDFEAEASGRLIRHLLEHPQAGSVFIAREGGRAVGYMVLTRCYSLEFGGPFVLLDEIFLLPEAQGQGLGKRLIDTAAGYCRENGFGYLRLEVQKKNLRAIDVYRAAGFHAEDRFLLSRPVARRD